MRRPSCSAADINLTTTVDRSFAAGSRALNLCCRKNGSRINGSSVAHLWLEFALRWAAIRLTHNEQPRSHPPFMDLHRRHPRSPSRAFGHGGLFCLLISHRQGTARTTAILISERFCLDRPVAASDCKDDLA